MPEQMLAQGVARPGGAPLAGPRLVIPGKPAGGEGLPRVSAILVNYNGQKWLGNCLSSLLNQDYPDFEAILVDNGSTDGSAEYVEREFARVTLLRAGENLGFGGANNLAARQATGEYLAFLNPDTAVEPGWLRALIGALHGNPGVGLATPKILLLSRPDRINTCGNDVHFTGIPTVRGWMLPRDAMDRAEEVCSVSGAAFVIRRSVFEEIGGFDDSFFLYAEDDDLSWRALLAGYRCLYVPESVVYHEYTPRFGPEKVFYLERNRYQMLLKSLRWRTLVLLLPALALTEVITWGYALLQSRRHILAKLRTYGWFVSHWAEVMEAREAVQKRRKAPDRALLSRCSHHMAYGLASAGPMAKGASLVFDPLFSLLYCVYLIAVRW